MTNPRWVSGISGNPEGRPKGVPNRAARQLLEQARERGLEPFSVLLDAIAHFRDRAAATNDEAERDKFVREAVGIAQIAAPFCHAKLKQIEVESTERREATLLLGRMSEDELLERLDARKARVIDHRPPLKLVHGEDTDAAT